MDQSDSFGDFSKSLSRERSFRFDDILKSKKRLLQKEKKKESINKKEMKKVQKKWLNYSHSWVVVNTTPWSDQKENYEKKFFRSERFRPKWTLQEQSTQ